MEDELEEIEVAEGERRGRGDNPCLHVGVESN